MANRNLIDYLPQFMQEYLEMQKIMNAEQPEINGLWTAADNTFKDQFIMDATEYGVSRWESMLGISPQATDTLDERKYRILTRLNQELPYTMRKLQEYLTNLIGADGYSITLTANSYYILIKIALGKANMYDAVSMVVQKMIPANMTVVIQIMYNTHQMLSVYTHSQMSAKTHTQLREDVIS